MEKKRVEPVIEKGGFAIYEKGNKIILVNRKLDNTFTLIFVLLLLTIILGVNGGIIMTSHVFVGSLLILISILGASLIYLLYKKLKQKQAAEPNEKTIIAMIDLEQNLFLDSKGNQLAPMGKVKFSKSFNITSSSPSIKVKWGKGKSKILFKFNGLVGGSKQFIAYFKQKGYWN